MAWPASRKWAKASLIGRCAAAGGGARRTAVGRRANRGRLSNTKARRGIVTLPELRRPVAHTAAAIESDAAVAEEFRLTPVFRRGRVPGRHPLQQRKLLSAWLGDRDSDLTVVGDASQTIYSFTGALLVLPLDFAAVPDAAVSAAGRDYRSTRR